MKIKELKEIKRFPSQRRIQRFLVELTLYAIFLVIYFLLVLRVLGEPLAELYQEDLGLYAITSLALIVIQAVLLDYVVAWIVSKTGLGRKRD